eukprot:TRINITY_DN31492_c0_g1_i1.p1 TRINITY_DN31492_c0_g1~~TRINITY_DN31492_c0_g1_i1.p1  ORF type:complete len:258 (-),score=26.45 TRINITY_DN31492_c0_g1_i1:35-757(-)
MNEPESSHAQSNIDQYCIGAEMFIAATTACGCCGGEDQNHSSAVEAITETSSVFQDPSLTTMPKVPEFTVTIDRSKGASLGMEIETSLDQTLCLVIGFRAHGLLERWNTSCPSGREVKRFDRVMKVNGYLATAKELVSKLEENTGILILTMEHPVIREIMINRQGRKLGLRLHVSDKNSALSILSVDNAEFMLTVDSGKSQPLTISDRIVAINGVTKKPSEMFKEMNTEDQFIMTVHSYT